MLFLVLLALAVPLAPAAKPAGADDSARPAASAGKGAAPAKAPPAQAPALIDVDLENADVHAALRFLADAGAVNLVVGDDVAGTITLQLHGVTWDEAFWAVLGQDHLTAVTLGSTIEIHGR